MNYREIQSLEITTIKNRNITLQLSDTDCDKLSVLAGLSGLPIGSLLNNFIGDLVDGTYSNGSDERMYANEWYNRCHFGGHPDKTYLNYLLKNDVINEYIELEKLHHVSLSNVQSLQNKSYDERVCCDTKECWENEKYYASQLENFWNDFVLSIGDIGTPNKDNEISKILKWKEDKQLLIDKNAFLKSICCKKKELER